MTKFVHKLGYHTPIKEMNRVSHRILSLQKLHLIENKLRKFKFLDATNIFLID